MLCIESVRVLLFIDYQPHSHSIPSYNLCNSKPKYETDAYTESWLSHDLYDLTVIEIYLH